MSPPPQVYKAFVLYFQAVLEIHDEVAAQIENYTEEVEYMDGVSSVDEDGDPDNDEKRLPDVQEGRRRDRHRRLLQPETEWEINSIYCH